MRRRKLESNLDKKIIVKQKKVITVKQKATFTYLNSLRGKITKSRGSLRDMFMSFKKPFDEIEVGRVTGILQPHEIAEYQLWTNVLDIIIKIDRDLFAICKEYASWITDLSVFLYIIHQENVTHLLNKLSLKIPIKKDPGFIESIKEKVIAKSVVETYLSSIETIYTSLFYFYAMHCSIDHGLDEKEDLCITQSLELLHDGERAFLTIFSFLTNSQEYKRENLHLTAIYTDKIETIRGWIYEMLTIHADVLAKNQIYVPADEVERALNYAQKRFSDGIFRNGKRDICT